MQFSETNAKLVLPAVIHLVKSCRTHEEFRRKFPKYYNWFWSNRKLNYLILMFKTARGRPKLKEQERILSEHRRRAKLRQWKQKPQNKLAQTLRNRLHSALKGQQKVESTFNLVGCSLIELKNYLEARFKPGMTWANHGKWHIDHRKPCISFNLSLPEEQHKCFHYTNLQPLWAADNIRKNSKFSNNLL